MKNETIKTYGVDLTCYSDGSVEWIEGRWGNTHRTFGFNSNGYRQVNILGHRVYVHRLIAEAFLSDYSAELQPDHINGKKDDNRPDNLRMVTHRQNQRGFKAKKKGATSQYRGVCWNPQRRHYKAQITVNGKHRNLGTFHDEELAAKAYDVAASSAGHSPESLNFN